MPRAASGCGGAPIRSCKHAGRGVVSVWVHGRGARSSNAVADAVVGLSIAAVASGLAVLQMRLAVRITTACGRTRRTVVGVEIAMT